MFNNQCLLNSIFKRRSDRVDCSRWQREGAVTNGRRRPPTIPAGNTTQTVTNGRRRHGWRSQHNAYSYCLLLLACLPSTIAIQWLELATVFFLHPASQWNMTGSASTFLLLGLLCLKYKNSLSGFGRKISPFHHQPLGLASQDNKNTRFGAKEI